MTQHSSEWCHRDVNGSEANRVPTPNKTTVDQWWIDVGFHYYPLLLPLIIPVPGYKAPCPPHIWPVEFLDVQNSLNWFSLSRVTLKYNGGFQNIKHNDQFVLDLPALPLHPFLTKSTELAV